MAEASSKTPKKSAPKTVKPDAADTKTEPKKAVAEVVTASGVRFSSHDLRRTFLTLADGLPGVSSYVLKGLAGHKAQDVTGRVYVQLPVEKLRGPVQTIERYILAAAGVKSKALAAPRRRSRG